VRVLAPHAPGLARRWSGDGVEVETFRYAPERLENLGYGRSLAADERVRPSAALALPTYLLAARGAVRRALAERPGAIVHAHWVVPNAWAAAAAIGRGGRLAVGLHGSDVFLAEKRSARALTRWALARARLLTGCSPELVERVCRVGFPAADSRVIPYGVDAELFRPDPSRRRIWRERLGVPPDAPLLLGVGRMATKKGFQVLLAGLGRLFAAAPGAHLVLAGDGDRRAEFRALASGFADRVHFPGTVEHDELPDLYRAADLFTLPAVHDARGNVDGLPNVVLEAMASALPVVASRISGIPLAVEEGRTGLLVAEGDGAALVSALAAILSRPDRGRSLGDAGRARVEQELTWDAVAARYRDAYRETLVRA
jgi:glycosyltransferase involved in cell wall biosynthesis